MSNLKSEIKALERVTLNRLLFINKTIRENRRTFSKAELTNYKEKRKQTDKLLSKIKHIGIDTYKYQQLKNEYMTT